MRSLTGDEPVAGAHALTQHPIRSTLHMGGVTKVKTNEFAKHIVNNR